MTARRKTAPPMIAVVGALAELLLGGCSLIGLYDGACCRFAPPGPPSDTVGTPTTFTIYSTSGARLGTVVPQAGTVWRGR